MASSPVIRPLSGVARAFAALQSRLYRPPTQTISTVNDQNWPSALQPVQPVAPAGAQPLGFSYWQGVNLNITPRPDAELSFADLRDLATYPLARICIENIKDQILSLPWSIQLREQPGESLKDRRRRMENDDVIPALTSFWQYPDGETPWQDWGRPLLEDMLVIDAGCILVQRTFNGKVVACRVPDGSQFLRLIDDQGYTPRGGDPAYTQLWEGIPRILLTADQLVYRPRNIVRRNTLSSQLYGCSPTEQTAPEIRIGQERLKYVLAFYTDGSVPGMVRMIPPGVNPDVIAEGERWMNSDMAGDLAKRRQWRDIQSYSGDVTTGPKDTIHELKEPILADAFDELHIRKIAFAYGTSPQRLLKQMNRASAEASQDSATEEGMLPWLRWLKGCVDLVIQRRMNLPDYEIIFDTATELDPSKQAEIDTLYVKTGIYTVNERRDMRGDEARPEPEANQLMVVTATGAVPLAGTIERTNEAHQAAISHPDGAGGDEDGQDEPGLRPQGAETGEGSAGKVAKRAIAINVARGTRTTRAARKSLTKILHREFAMQANHVADVVRGHYKPASKSKKVRKDTDDAERKELQRLIEEVLETDWADLPEQLQNDLADVAIEAGQTGLDQVGIDIKAVINRVNSIAANYAETRAAEMVGMRWDDGKLVQNPNAKWAISDTTRDRLRTIAQQAFEDETSMQELVDRILAADAFSESRAEMIARTEVAMAQGRGNLAGWKASGLVEEVSWILSADHDPLLSCNCQENADHGPFPIDELPDFPDHPNCMCVLAPTKIKGVSL
jgi:hypothetical protein